jgi:hypothetical protein
LAVDPGRGTSALRSAVTELILASFNAMTVTRLAATGK